MVHEDVGVKVFVIASFVFEGDVLVACEVGAVIPATTHASLAGEVRSVGNIGISIIAVYAGDEESSNSE